MDRHNCFQRKFNRVHHNNKTTALWNQVIDEFCRGRALFKEYAILVNITKLLFFENATNFVIAPNGLTVPSKSPITSKPDISVDRPALVSANRWGWLLLPYVIRPMFMATSTLLKAPLQQKLPGW